MKNKDLIDALHSYFMKSDPEAVALCLAGMTVDIVRFMSLDALSDEERHCLFGRSAKLMEDLARFIKNQDQPPLRVTRLSSDHHWEEKMKEAANDSSSPDSP